LAFAVFTAIAFQSTTASAFAMADPNNRVAINAYMPQVLFLVLSQVPFIVLPPDSSLAFAQ